MLCGSRVCMRRCVGSSLLHNVLHSASERVQLLSTILGIYVSQGADEFVEVHALMGPHCLVDAVLQLLVLDG